jgi:predicted nucleic acid-binding protein
VAVCTFSCDTSDDAFIHAALAAGAQWLITDDEDLLTVGSQVGLHIITPAVALLESVLHPSV